MSVSSKESVKLILDTLSKHPEILVNLKENHGEYLDLELLFDFYFVQPAISAKRKADLNLKLKAAGKPELP